MKTLILGLIILASQLFSYSQTTKTESEKIAIFCKVWGFLKYYHPEVAKGKIDWDKEFTNRVKEVSKLNSKEEISNYYSQWIISLGKVKKCKSCENKIPDSLKFNLDLKFLDHNTLFTNRLIKQLHYIQHNRNQEENYYVQQVKGLGNTSYKNEKPYMDSIFPSPELRLLGLSRYWNIINYFYPYKYKIGQDWNGVLIEMIPKFKDTKDTITYHLAMLELTAKINDSNAKFSTEYTDRYFGLEQVPFSYKIIDNKAIVTGYFYDSLCKINDIKYGDVFLKINNLDIGDLLKEQSKYLGASNEAVKTREFSTILFNGQSDSVSATFERDGVVKQKFIYRYYFNDSKYKWRNFEVIYKFDTCKILDDNIGYVNLGLMKFDYFRNQLLLLKNTKAIIFDVRNGVPDYPYGILSEITSFLDSDAKFITKQSSTEISYPGL